MDTEKMTEMLFEKMSAEQDKYRDWLLAQPPEEILNHTFEYTARQDILMAVQDNTLDTAQLEALLKSPSPLADVYKDFSKLDSSDQMETIQTCIADRADRTLQAEREATLNTPVYPHSLDYAKEHGEVKEYDASYQANVACKEAIEKAIGEHYDGAHFDSDLAVKQVMDAFGPERTSYVLANTVQHKDWDGRISNSNKEWAKTIPVAEDNQARKFVVDKAHPGLTNLFVQQARKDMTEKEQTREKKPSILKKLHEAAQEGKAPLKPHKAKEQER